MGTFDDFLASIAGQESGGNYQAVNRDTGAMGKYQILPSNVTPWAKQYLGVSVTPQQFLNNSTLQDRLARAVLQDYVNKWGYDGAASAWYSGSPNLKNSTSSQGGYPSIGSYVSSVMGRMSESVQNMAMASASYGTVRSFNDTHTIVPMMKVEDQQPLDAEAQKGAGIRLSSNPAGLASPTGDQPPATEGAGMSVGQSNDPQQNPLEQPVPQMAPPKSDVVLEPGGGKYLNPIQGYHPAGEWGHYASGGPHLALDFAVPIGTTARAPMDGKIVSAGWESGGFGLAIRIQNADGTYTILGHLSTLYGVRPGDQIKAGMPLAGSGSTGNSTGPHLHVEFRKSLYDPGSAFNFTGNMQW